MTFSAFHSLNAASNPTRPNAKSQDKFPIANPSEQAARNVAKNPFGLVYANAMTKNE